MSASLTGAFNNLSKTRQAFRHCKKAEMSEILSPSQTCIKNVMSFTLSSGECFLCGDEIALQASSIALSCYVDKNTKMKAWDHKRGYLGLHFENDVS